MAALKKKVVTATHFTVNHTILLQLKTGGVAPAPSLTWKVTDTFVRIHQTHQPPWGLQLGATRWPSEQDSSTIGVCPVRREESRAWQGLQKPWQRTRRGGYRRVRMLLLGEQLHSSCSPAATVPLTPLLCLTMKGATGAQRGWCRPSSQSQHLPHRVPEGTWALQRISTSSEQDTASLNVFFRSLLNFSGLWVDLVKDDWGSLQQACFWETRSSLQRIIHLLCDFFV